MRVALLVGGPVIQGVSACLGVEGWTLKNADSPEEARSRLSVAWLRSVSVVVCDPNSVRKMSKMGKPVVAVAKHFPDGESSARALLAKGAVGAVERQDEATLLAVVNAALALG